MGKFEFFIGSYFFIVFVFFVFSCSHYFIILSTMLSTPPLTVANHHQQPLLYFSTNNSFQPPTLFHYFLQLQPFLSTIFCLFNQLLCSTTQPAFLFTLPSTNFCHPHLFFFANNFFNLSFSATFNNHFLLLIQPSCNQPILPIIFQPFLCAILLNNLHSHPPFQFSIYCCFFLLSFPPPPVFLDQMCCLPTAHLGGELCRGPSS